MSSEAKKRIVRVLINKRSGLPWSFDGLLKAFVLYWGTSDNDLSYQFSKDAEDGYQKAKCAAEQGVDILLVVGGDGTINTAGSALIGTDTALGAIPTGSGNGFARHFGIPLKPEAAAKVLADGYVRSIDVGIVNDMPFLVTCSMAWDAAIVRSFDKSPIRGVIPYIFAGVYEFFEYDSQPMTATLDSGEVIEFIDPLVLTVANLTQYGGGAIIAPGASPDDGQLDLVAALQQDAPILLNNITKLFNGAFDEIPELLHRSFSHLTITRKKASPIQIDGELVDASEKLIFTVKSSALNILVPKE